MIKQDIVNTYIELFTRGEMLKGEKFINECVPLELVDDETIVMLRNECNERMSDIRKWSKEGRPYPGTYATVKFEDFPKFVLAREKILKRHKDSELLDIGCYSGVFINEMIGLGFYCHGIDIHKELMKILQDKYNDGRTNFGCVENMRYGDNSFDIVTAFDVLEHTVDFDKALTEIERVCKPEGLIIINLPRMTPGYKDESFEHLRMFSDKDIERIWGKKKDYKFELCQDELGRDTSFITYVKD